MVMVLCYLLYIVLMVVNPRVERWAHRTKNRVRTKIFPNRIQGSAIKCGLGLATGQRLG